MQSSKAIVLRCVHCSGPLDDVKPEDGYIKCKWCGYVQRLVDAEKYIEKLRGEIYQWLKEMIPPTVITAGVNIDPISRHNIFVFNVKPRIIGDYILCKGRLSTLMSYPLIYLPSWTPPEIKIEEEPRSAYERLAKIESINALVAVEEDAAFFNEVRSTMGTYAHMLNMLDLLRRKAELTFIIKNIEAAASSLENLPGHEVEHDRLSATYKLYKAVEKLIYEEDVKSALLLIEEGERELKRSLEEARKVASLAPLIPGITKDLHIAEVIKNIAQAASRLLEVGKPVTEFLAYVENFFRFMEAVRTSESKDFSIYNEITRYLKDIILAKNGIPEVEVLPGRGEILFPVWDVSFTYTFVTGALFMKKGKEVEERLLIAATIPMASRPVTDVFRIGPSAGLLDKITGKEETLSGGVLKRFVEQARKTSIPASQKVIPPLSTKEIALEYVEKYLKDVVMKTGGKIKFGAGDVKRLLFIPASVKDKDIFIPELGGLQFSVSPYLPDLLKIAL